LSKIYSKIRRVFFLNIIKICSFFRKTTFFFNFFYWWERFLVTCLTYHHPSPLSFRVIFFCHLHRCSSYLSLSSFFSYRPFFSTIISLIILLSSHSLFNFHYPHIVKISLTHLFFFFFIFLTPHLHFPWVKKKKTILTPDFILILWSYLKIPFNLSNSSWFSSSVPIKKFVKKTKIFFKINLTYLISSSRFISIYLDSSRFVSIRLDSFDSFRFVSIHLDSSWLVSIRLVWSRLVRYQL